MASENKVQELIHKLEEGGWAKWVWLSVLVAAVSYVGYLWLFKENGFKGLTHPRAFEQAEIAREIARGHGFTTRIIRPVEIWLFEEHHRPYPLESIPDTYHAPLWPVVLAPFLNLVRKTWPMTLQDISYTSDKVIVSVALGFFLLSVALNFLIARRLFDQRLALMGVGLLLLCDRLWQFSMSGLPQMLMLFCFSLAVYALMRLIELRETRREQEEEAARLAPEDGREEEPEEVLPFGEGPGFSPDPMDWGERWRSARPFLLWSAAAGVAFGLLALTHAMGIWLAVGALIYLLLSFRGRRLAAGLPLLLIFTALYSPWLVRNYRVCGTPAGVSWYSGLYQIRGTENAIMRSRESPVAGATPTMFRRKLQSQFQWQTGRLPELFGNALLAPVFFIALLHLFKRRPTASFRWCALVMWLAGFFGMCVFGLDEQLLAANDLHVLFIPLFTFYGLAYVLVLWSRLEIGIRLLRIGFLVFLFVISSFPFLFHFIELHSGAQSRVEWPPYVPPSIAHLASWTNDREIIASDMPWAVAWYADRKSLWLPMTVKEFIELNDWDKLQSRLVGLYLTPISGDQPFLSGVVKGDYREWAPFLMRNVNLRAFPLKAVLPLPIDNQCVFYADRDRWTLHED